MNLFGLKGNQSIRHIVTGVAFDNDRSQILLECRAEGEKAYEEFKNNWLSDNDKQIFEAIPMITFEKDY